MNFYDFLVRRALQNAQEFQRVQENLLTPTFPEWEERAAKQRAERIEIAKIVARGLDQPVQLHAIRRTTRDYLPLTPAELAVAEMKDPGPLTIESLRQAIRDLDARRRSS